MRTKLADRLGIRERIIAAHGHTPGDVLVLAECLHAALDRIDALESACDQLEAQLRFLDPGWAGLSEERAEGETEKPA